MKFRGRGFDHLGTLVNKLAELQGFATLAQEIIQNADDVGDAGWLRFDVRTDALVVDNGGTFRSCGRLDESDCPWLTDQTKRRRCDFHRFARIGAGDKRFEKNTTGAKGIGFLSVYQVTDHPELISNGQHWILDEAAASEEQRIRICDEGCERCRGLALPGTRFLLPWAFDSESDVRQGLQAQAFPPHGPDDLLEALREFIPDSMLFLRSLDRIEVAKDRHQVLEVNRLVHGSDVIVDTDGAVRSWRRFSSSFEQEAQALKQEFYGMIEDDRSAAVTVAFTDEANDGRLFAWLPTQEPSGLPCHVQADFFPTNDRKRLLWEQDYRADWNRAALRASALAIATNAPSIRDYVGHKTFWTLCRSASRQSETLGATFKCFWEELLPALRDFESVYTSANTWVDPAGVVVVDPVYRECLPAIEALGIVVVHPDLDFARNQLTGQTNGLAIKTLRLQTVIDAISELDITEGTPLADSPSLFADPLLRHHFWHLLELLLGSPQPPTRDEQDRLCGFPVLTGHDNNLWSPDALSRADVETAELFQSLGIDLPFLSIKSDFERLASLVSPIGAETLIASLERLNLEGGAGEEKQQDRVPFLQWFAARQAEFDRHPELKPRLAALPMFPSGAGYRTLDVVSLPSRTFEDPLGIAEVVDVSRIRATVPFLETLGASTLSLADYAKRHVPRALAEKPLPPEVIRTLALLLAKQLGELRPDEECRQALRDAAFVETVDGTFVPPASAYFPSAVLRLLPAVHVAKLGPKEHQPSLQALYEWLGVESEPRFEDIYAAIAASVSQSPTPEHRAKIAALFEHLGERLLGQDTLPSELSDLVRLPWLPAESDETHWSEPGSLAAVFNKNIFWSQASFLDIGSEVQYRPGCAHLIKLLGVHASPTVQQVVLHLRHCANNNLEVPDILYQRLSEERWSADPALEVLRNVDCIYLSLVGYVSPRKVFWSEHGFGRYRFTLTSNLNACVRFLDRVGVRRSPEPADAVEVLLDLAADPSLRGQVLPREAVAVVEHCWQFLADAYRTADLPTGSLSVLKDQAVVLDAAGMLNRPNLLFLEDRPNLATHFRTSLGPNVIPLPDRAAPVLEAAGVRRLSKHVAVELLECEARSENHYLANHCASRRDQLHRTVAAAGLASHDGSEWAQLVEIEYQASTKLTVRYVCAALGRPMFSEPQRPKAVFLAQEDALIVEFHDGKVSWPDVARELAVAVYPLLEPGRVSTAFLQALSQDSPESADELLDALGLPRIVRQQPAVGVPGTEVGDIGTKGPVPMPPSLFSPPTSPSAPSTTPGPRRPQKRRSRFVTYVAPDEPPSDEPNDHAPDGPNREIEQAGIRLATWSEESEGRTVTVMPVNHPGYDLESRSPDGELERYVEVKALSSDWGADGVGLTGTEFNRAREMGDRYWLYVVERATSHAPQLYRIQDPARKANWFFFDRGWSQVAVQQGQKVGSPTDES